MVRERALSLRWRAGEAQPVEQARQQVATPDLVLDLRVGGLDARSQCASVLDQRRLDNAGLAPMHVAKPLQELSSAQLRLGSTTRIRADAGPPIRVSRLAMRFRLQL